MDAPDRSRRSAAAWLAAVLRHSYREEGVARSLARAPRFVREDLLGERLRWHLLTHPVRDRLVDRAELTATATEGADIWYGDDQDPVTVDLPPTPEADPVRGDLPRRLASKVGTYQPARPFVREFRDARVVGPDALGFVDDRLVLETASASEMYLAFALGDLYDRLAADRPHHRAYPLYRKILAGDRPMPPPPEGVGDDPNGRDERNDPDGRDAGVERLETAAFFLPYWRNYYHWTVEFLPKVRLLERYRAATGREPTVVVEADPPGWLTDTLGLAGWDPDACVEWPETTAQVDRLVVPVHRNHYVTPRDGQFADDFNPATGDLRWLAERMQSNVSDPAGGDFSSRIFLSRRDTKFRPVANEDAIAETLAPLGFESYVLTDLSLADQIRLFVGADTIVAPHGAGLVNMIHAADASVLELFPADNVEPYYFCLARQLGFDYDWRIYPTEDEVMVVDTDDLRAAVSDVIEA